MDMTDTPDDLLESEEDPPDFSEWEDPETVFKGGPTRERLLDVVVQLRKPTKVSTIADRAECDTETARDYLEWFAEMGMAQELSGRPVRYERNDSYLRWRRTEQIRETYSDAEIVEKLQETLEEIESYRDQFDADAPYEVSLVVASRERTVEDAWGALAQWQSLERRAELLDAARRDSSGFGGRGSRIDA